MASQASRPEYEQAAAWAEETYGRGLRTERAIAWVGAAAASLAATLLALALANLGPLSRGAPYIIGVERQSGALQQSTRLQPGALTSAPDLAASHAARYVALREGFRRLSADQARVINLWSTAGVAAEHSRELALDPGTLGVPPTAVVKSVSLVQPDKAVVRYDLVGAGPSPLITAWQATVDFRYDDAPLARRDRLDNPLGFQVVRYYRQPDAAAPTGPYVYR
jgi:type IV secretion system protein VirB8